MTQFLSDDAQSIIVQNLFLNNNPDAELLDAHSKTVVGVASNSSNSCSNKSRKRNPRQHNSNNNQQQPFGSGVGV